LVNGPLTLNEAILIALANNPELLATEREVDAAAAQRDVVAGQRLPSLRVTGGYNYYLDSQRLISARENGEPGLFSRNIFASDIVVSLPLFTGGRITSEVKAAELLQKAAEHRLSRTREEMVFNVSSVFYSILAQRRVIESLEFSKKALQEHLKQVKDLLAAQKAAKVDQLRTEVRLADVEQRLVRERNVLAIQARVLTNLLGIESPEKPVEPAGELAFTQATIPETDSALRQAFVRRADYLAARAALEAQAKSVDGARAAQWPIFSLQGAYGGRWATDPTEQQAGSSTSGDVGRVGVVVDIPIFEGGRVNARIRQEKARLLAAQERLRRLQLQIHLDIETAVLNISSSTQRVKAIEKAVEQAKESLRIEREKYDLGKGAIVDVLDAQSAVLESQTNYYRALADLNIAIAQMKLATGERLK
jgi:outer membrane protein TolC